VAHGQGSQSADCRHQRPGRVVPSHGRLALIAVDTNILVHDAQIAAVCLEQGATTVLTEDRDFERFSGISVRRLGAV